MRLNITDQIITRPTSAYAILDRVITLIQDEPKRLRMGTWFSDWSDYPRPSGRPPYFPACGTVACAAGWMGYVTGWKPRSLSWLSWSDIADVIAGFSLEASTQLRRGFCDGDHFISPDGTQKQADLTAAWLRSFQRKYEPELRRRIILLGGIVKE